MSEREIKLRMLWVAFLAVAAVIALIVYIIITHDATPLIVVAFFMIPVVLEIVNRCRKER